MQQVEVENARLRADGLRALPQLILMLQSHRLPSLDTKRIGKPVTFSVKREEEEEWREGSVNFGSFVVGVHGENMRAVLMGCRAR
eukprot:540873-Amphidinium_carterae.1